MVEAFEHAVKELPGRRWSWPTWYVHVKGRYDFARLQQWSLRNVYDAYYNLRLNAAFENG